MKKSLVALTLGISIIAINLIGCSGKHNTKSDYVDNAGIYDINREDYNTWQNHLNRLVDQTYRDLR